MMGRDGACVTAAPGGSTKRQQRASSEEEHMSRWLASVLPLLAVLACPVMMLLCLRGMRGHGDHQQAPSTSARSLPDSSPDGTAERLATLERELAALRADRDRAADQPRPSPGPAAPPGRTAAERR
jgi:hypothetical protein